ncbi:enolase C-terminal domain-like protein [Croceicoccus sediminis]|uniref:enolase C-terminal domain-like protein n=1 Tax=Croceicoccus sediminis TaxID=2571150 RepID=UPI0011826E95|nr:enolase C-terminal domain-like protein [Croceicoccus sediminis]
MNEGPEALDLRVETVTIVPVEGNAEICRLLLGTNVGIVGMSLCDKATGLIAAKLGNSAIAGKDPRAAPALYHALHAADAAPPAIAALDIALWDAKSKTEGVPLWRTLGGSRGPWNVMRGDAKGQAIHVQLEGNLDQDLERIAAAQSAIARKIVEPVIALTFPANWNHPDDAAKVIAHAQAIERHFDIAFIELSLPLDSTGAHLAIGKVIRAALCNGRGFGRISDFRPALECRALDGYLLDVDALGLTGAMVVANAAAAYDLPVLLAPSMGNLALHLCGAMPNFAFAMWDGRLTASGTGRADQSQSVPGLDATLGDDPGIGLEGFS